MSGRTAALVPAPLLDRITDGCLGWLQERQEEFRLPASVVHDADPHTTLKPLGELAALSQVIRERHPRASVRAAATRLLGFAWEQTREGRLFLDLVRGEPQATYPVEFYGAFARAGLRDESVDALLRATTRTRSWRVARHGETRTLAVLAAERHIGLTPHAAFWSVLGRTGLGMRAEPWTLDRSAAYGITHDVFHLTDWGRARHRMPEALAEYLRLWVPAWLECWLEEELWDLTGEWLAVAACLPRPLQEPVAWERLAAAQRTDGAVPETGLREPEPDEVFRACYHSTLVTAFAATLARSAPKEPSAPAAAHARESEAVR
ncbi:hypothetical protein HUT18_13160 [Streptomyces sp. NA04227]|uniref:DUF6895 family protein n=1 Tax=Streptomyces sp. NA04227 TaxID=2742136 RepID=UPI001592769F|nr:hypothetical protein [Streptomyces sp. NA04227]QKW07206.1 hypothetical protein HUT18_13160 [Streptomyces sp. NA04227]